MTANHDWKAPDCAAPGPRSPRRAQCRRLRRETPCHGRRSAAAANRHRDGPVNGDARATSRLSVSLRAAARPTARRPPSLTVSVTGVVQSRRASLSTARSESGRAGNCGGTYDAAANARAASESGCQCQCPGRSVTAHVPQHYCHRSQQRLPGPRSRNSVPRVPAVAMAAKLQAAVPGPARLGPGSAQAGTPRLDHAGHRDRKRCSGRQSRFFESARAGSVAGISDPCRQLFQ